MLSNLCVYIYSRVPVDTYFTKVCAILCLFYSIILLCKTGAKTRLVHLFYRCSQIVSLLVYYNLFVLVIVKYMYILSNSKY